MPARGLHGIAFGVPGNVSVITYETESEAIFAAFTTPPTTARKGLIDAVVVALKGASIWTKLDALYLFAAADSQAAKINWINPGTYNCSEVNTPSFTADRGFTGASTAYLDSNFNPTTATTPKYVQDSASALGWSLTGGAISQGFIGNPVGRIIRVIPYSGVSAFYGLNRNSTPDGATNTDGTGLFTAVRTGASAQEFYRNGTSIDTNILASTGVPNEKIVFLLSFAGYWTGQIAAGGFGLQLSAADNTALYNAMRTYMTGVGVP